MGTATPTAAPPQPLTSLDEMSERAARAVAQSPADHTLVTWFEVRRGRAQESARTRRAEQELVRHVLVRVRAGGRSGSFRSESADPAALQSAIRSALAVARGAPRSPDWPDRPPLPAPPGDAFFDPELAQLAPAMAQQRLESWGERRASLRWSWSEARLVVTAEGSAPRALRFTASTLEARTGRRPGSGFAAGSSRHLARLAPAAIVARAREREAESDLAPPIGERALWLAPEASAVLVEALARVGFSSAAWSSGRGWLAETLGRPVLAARVGLVDDPTSPEGQPLPFDLDGTPTAAQVLVERGTPVAPVFDLELAARAGRRPTGHGIASDDAFPLHPRLSPGGASDADLAAIAADGLRVGALESLEVMPTPDLAFRARARGVRRIGADGALGAAAAQRIWHDSLLRVFAELEAVGGESVAWSVRGGELDSTQAAAIVVPRPRRLAPAPDER